MQTHRKINRSVIIGITLALLTACAGGSPTSSQPPSPLPTPSTATAMQSPLPSVTSPPPTLTIDLSIEYGLSQDQPAPIGVPVKAEDGLIITVLETKRNAEEELVSINPFNIFYPNDEAVLVRARVELPKDPPQPFTLLSIDFDIVDENGTLYAYPLTVIVADELKATMDRATTLEGYLAFVLPRGHTRLTMRYSPKDRGQTFSPRWFNLTP